MPFKLPQITACCCGCSLRIGVYIIAAINIVLLLLPGSLIIIFEINRLVRGNKVISRVEFLENDLLDLTLITRLTLAFCLLYGCYKDNPSCMLGFFMMQVVSLVHYVLFALLLVFMHIMGVFSEDIFIYTITAVLQGYSAIIVYSHYRNLKEGRSISI